MSDNILEIKKLNKYFDIDGQPVQVLKDIDLEVKRGEFVCIVGFSGCGKSTLLRMISGLETISDGEILVNGKPVTGPGFERGMIFQEPRLFPWKKVKDNIAYGLSNKRKKELGKEKTAELIQEYVKLVNLEGFENAYPRQLSGGMQQRVSLARSLVSDPDILLLDEPFGALDAITRMNMQKETLRIWKEDKKTMILVTHDIDEAIYLGQKVVVLGQRPGTIKKVIDVNLSSPRQRTSIEFSEIRRKIYKEFIEEEEIPTDYSI